MKIKGLLPVDAFINGDFSNRIVKCVLIGTSGYSSILGAYKTFKKYSLR